MSKHRMAQTNVMWVLPTYGSAYLWCCFIICLILQTGMANASESSLHSFIQLALEHNLDLKAEQLSLSKEEANFSRAKKQEFYPEIEIAGVSGQWSKKREWIKDEEGIDRKQITTTKEKPSIELNSSILRPHPFGGKVKLNLKLTEGISTSNQDAWEIGLESEEPLSKSGRQISKTPLFDKQLHLETAKINLKERINEVIYEVINSYTQLQRLNSTIIIKHKELEDLQSNIEISKLKVEKGLIPEMDIFQMELQASSVLSEMETLKKEKKGQIARFTQVLGTQTTIEDRQNSQGDFLKQVLVIKGEADNILTTLSMEEFPQVKTKYIQIELAKRGLKEAEAKNTPVLTPAFSVNRSGKTTQEEFKASVKFTLFDKGVKKEEVKIAKDSLAQAEIELNNLISNIRIDISTTLDGIKDTERRIGVLEKDIDLSGKIYEIARIKHQRGLISAKDMLEYQMDVFRKQKSLFEEQTDLFLDYVKLLKTTGELYHAYKKDIL